MVAGICRYTEKWPVNLKELELGELIYPKPSQYRIMVGTESVASMDDTDYRVVAKHLGHSTATQRSYYEVATCDGALKAYKK